MSFPKTVLANSGPAKTTSVLAKGYPSLNLNSGRSDDGSTFYDIPSCLLTLRSCRFVHHPVGTVADYEPRVVMITWQPCGKFSCVRGRQVSKSSLAPQDSIHVPEYS